MTIKNITSWLKKLSCLLNCLIWCKNLIKKNIFSFFCLFNRLVWCKTLTKTYHWFCVWLLSCYPRFRHQFRWRKDPCNGFGGAGESLNDDKKVHQCNRASHFRHRQIKVDLKSGQQQARILEMTTRTGESLS